MLLKSMEDMMISFIQRAPVNPAVKQFILYSEVKISFNIFFFLPNRICQIYFYIIKIKDNNFSGTDQGL